jgi:hypothetical protein
VNREELDDIRQDLESATNTIALEAVQSYRNDDMSTFEALSDIVILLDTAATRIRMMDTNLRAEQKIAGAKIIAENLALIAAPLFAINKEDIDAE